MPFVIHLNQPIPSVLILIRREGLSRLFHKHLSHPLSNEIQVSGAADTICLAKRRNATHQNK